VATEITLSAQYQPRDHGYIVPNIELSIAGFTIGPGPNYGLPEGKPIDDQSRKAAKTSTKKTNNYIKDRRINHHFI